MASSKLPQVQARQLLDLLQPVTTRVFRWTNSFRAVSDTFRLFSKELVDGEERLLVQCVDGVLLNTSWRNISHRVVGSW